MRKALLFSYLLAGFAYSSSAQSDKLLDELNDGASNTLTAPEVFMRALNHSGLSVATTK